MHNETIINDNIDMLANDFINPLGRSDFLRAIKPGQKSVWVCSHNENVHNDMKSFTATAIRLAITLKQKKVYLVSLDNLPKAVIIVERVR